MAWAIFSIGLGSVQVKHTSFSVRFRYNEIQTADTPRQQCARFAKGYMALQPRCRALSDWFSEPSEHKQRPGSTRADLISQAARKVPGSGWADFQSVLSRMVSGPVRTQTATNRTPRWPPSSLVSNGMRLIHWFKLIVSNRALFSRQC